MITARPMGSGWCIFIGAASRTEFPIKFLFLLVFLFFFYTLHPPSFFSSIFSVYVSFFSMSIVRKIFSSKLKRFHSWKKRISILFTTSVIYYISISSWSSEIYLHYMFYYVFKAHMFLKNVTVTELWCFIHTIKSSIHWGRRYCPQRCVYDG